MNTLTPKKLFLLDSAGALLTAVLTGIMLASFAEAIGLPRPMLRGLGLVAGMLAVYSFFNFYFFSSSWHYRLAVIAVANVLYGVVALGFVFYFRTSITALGVAYFLLETVIVTALAAVEWRTSRARVQ